MKMQDRIKTLTYSDIREAWQLTHEASEIGCDIVKRRVFREGVSASIRAGRFLLQFDMRDNSIGGALGMWEVNVVKGGRLQELADVKEDGFLGNLTTKDAVELCKKAREISNEV